jgi:hypothetical protein
MTLLVVRSRFLDVCAVVKVLVATGPSLFGFGYYRSPQLSFVSDIMRPPTWD